MKNVFPVAIAMVRLYSDRLIVATTADEVLDLSAHLATWKAVADKARA